MAQGYKGGGFSRVRHSFLPPSSKARRLHNLPLTMALTAITNSVSAPPLLRRGKRSASDALDRDVKRRRNVTYTISIAREKENIPPLDQTVTYLDNVITFIHAQSVTPETIVTTAVASASATATTTEPPASSVVVDASSSVVTPSTKSLTPSATSTVTAAVSAVASTAPTATDTQTASVEASTSTASAKSSPTPSGASSACPSKE
ncbi:hypothetical protein BD626DRAFT_477261 [Schizophyllum amplum]|uniref:Uncharacterized protein n=1 Tax=Schizophyllum amplum TaxID=97359 RepID=A0A550D012_9AGAR|nr:hypothetical protein BD626DRAFT_477261 [Auriculariopsis ampla]